MSQEDQEALAAQWAAQLEDEANAAEPAAAEPAPAPAGAGLDEEALAAQWAESLAADEEDKGPASFGAPGAGFGGQAVDAHFQDMTEMARQPKDTKLKRELDFILDIPVQPPH